MNTPTKEQNSLKLATWNVNSLGVRLPHLLQWLGNSPVDAVGLQELKLTDDKFPHAELQAAGYHSVAFGQKTYNGVAIVSKRPVRDVQRNIPGFVDEQSRVIAATLDDGTPEGLRFINGYFVNGQAPGSDKFEYKMSWLRALRDWLREEVAAHPKLALVGDFNITWDDRDTWDPVGLKDTIHHTEEERHHFQAIAALGLHDSFRLFDQPPKSFSWWDYRMLAFQKGQGMRIDYVMVSNALKPQVRACHIDKTPRKWQKPSDHTPVVCELAI
jgi:exodeoxyribonuclease III